MNEKEKEALEILLSYQYDKFGRHASSVQKLAEIFVEAKDEIDSLLRWGGFYLTPVCNSVFGVDSQSACNFLDEDREENFNKAMKELKRLCEIIGNLGKELRVNENGEK